MTVHSEWCDLQRAEWKAGHQPSDSRGDDPPCTCGADRAVAIGVEVSVSAGISDDEPIVGDTVTALGRALHEADPTDRRWRVRLRGKPVLFDGGWNAYVDGKRLGHDCLASVPAPPGGGSWSELAIPGVTTWRCGCGQEWVWRRTGWERLVEAESDDVEEGRFDRAVLAASLAEAVSAVDAAARRLRAAWRNVGGDAGNVEGGA